MPRIITLNLNGIRSACSKGFLSWAARQRADVICVQELKAQHDDMAPAMHRIGKLTGHFYPAQKKGYAGVGLYCRGEPRAVRRGFGADEFDQQGRYLEADFGDYAVISLYLPSGSAGPERQASKFRFLAAFLPHLRALIAAGKDVVICGDLNIAHKEIDLKNWKSNQKNSGFLPEERQWLSTVFDEVGFVDVFRTLDQRAEQYTWWSNRGQSWAKNVGWRLDYQLATPEFAKRAHATQIYLKQRFSDHAPLIVDYHD